MSRMISLLLRTISKDTESFAPGNKEGIEAKLQSGKDLDKDMVQRLLDTHIFESFFSNEPQKPKRVDDDVFLRGASYED